VRTHNGVELEFRDGKAHITTPDDMTLMEALASLQPYIDFANERTGMDLKLVLPEEPAA